MPVNCAVAECTNYGSSKNEEKKISFHRFPKDPSIRNSWIKQCKRRDKFNADTGHVCSAHFAATDYVPDVRFQLFGGKETRKLKSGVIPHLQIPNSSAQNTKSDNERENRVRARQAKKERDQFITECLEKHSENRPQRDESNNITAVGPVEWNVPDVAEDQAVDYKRLYEEEKEKNKVIEEQYSTMRKELEQYKQAYDVLHELFTENEIALLSRRKKQVTWTDDEIAKAFTLRLFSQKSYVFLRNKLGFPLPGLSSLRRWAAKIDMRTGILNDVLRIMFLNGKTMDTFQKLTVLSFDEMKVSEVLEYDKHADEVLGPSRYVQVAMARGLCSNWKQPVFVSFDTDMTKKILFDILTRLEEGGYPVVCCTCDMGGQNRGLWKSLGVNHEKPFFLHPSTGQEVFCMPDVPHVLKLTRNWLLDTGFVLDGTVINSEPLYSLLEFSSTELNACFHLTENHLNVKKAQRQNVRLAAELLSRKTGTALLNYKPGADKNAAEELGKFILLVNDYFDLLNVRTRKMSIPSTSAYGMFVEEQNKLLEEVQCVFEKIRCVGKNGLQVFQEGILMTTRVLPKLFTLVSEKYNVKYIMTHKLNQDIVENLFFRIRIRGGLYDHPSPLTVLQRLRQIILSTDPGIVSRNTNVREDVGDFTENKEEFMTVTAFQKANITISHEEEKNDVADEENDEAYLKEEEIISGNPMVEIEEDGLRYLAGYIVHKHQKSTREVLGIRTGLQEHNYQKPSSWIGNLSYGGLIEPSNEFVNKLKIAEGFLMKIIGTGIPKGPGIIRNTSLKVIAALAENGIQVPDLIIQKYVKLRIFIRMKFLTQKGFLFASKRRKEPKLRNNAKLRKICI